QLRHALRGAGAVRQGGRADGGRQCRRRLPADSADVVRPRDTRWVRPAAGRQRRPGQDAAQARLAEPVGRPDFFMAKRASSFIQTLTNRIAPRSAPTAPVRADRERFKGTMIARGLTKSYKGR